MEEALAFALSVFDRLVELSVLLVETVGIAVLLVSVGRAAIGALRSRPRVRLSLAEGIALALECKLGGELLRTVTVREWSELWMLGAVILLRAALTFLIQWEIRIEKKEEAMQKANSSLQSMPPRSHRMTLADIPFRRMAFGSKWVEVRLFDKKRRAIKEGDTVTFAHKDTPTLLYTARVARVAPFPSFRDLYAAYPPAALGYGEEECANAEEMYTYYAREEEKKWGAVAIELEKT